MAEPIKDMEISGDDSMERVYTELAKNPEIVEWLDDTRTRNAMVETLRGNASIKLENLGWFVRLPDGTWQGPGGVYNQNTVLGKKAESALATKKEDLRKKYPS